MALDGLDEDIPGFWSVAVGGLCHLGLMAQDGLRQAFKSIEQGSQFSILMRRGAKHGHHIASEFHVDRLALGLKRPLEVRSVAFGRVVAASALSLAALHHALEQRSCAEELQVLEFLFRA